MPCSSSSRARSKSRHKYVWQIVTTGGTRSPRASMSRSMSSCPAVKPSVNPSAARCSSNSAGAASRRAATTSMLPSKKCCESGTRPPWRSIKARIGASFAAPVGVPEDSISALGSAPAASKRLATSTWPKCDAAHSAWPRGQFGPSGRFGSAPCCRSSSTTARRLRSAAAEMGRLPLGSGSSASPASALSSSRTRCSSPSAAAMAMVYAAPWASRRDATA